jgi:hypothetical protein
MSMRHLTASQKIAQLENRIAHLEKQAFLEGIQQKVSAWIEAKLPYKREVKKAVLSEYSIRDMKSAEKAAKYVVRDLKDPHHMTALSMIVKSESTFKGRVEMALNIKNHPEMFEGRTASAFAVAALSVTALLVGVVWTSIKQVFRLASHNKQGGIPVIVGVIISILGGVAFHELLLTPEKKTKEIGHAISRGLIGELPGIKSIEKVSENMDEVVIKLEIADTAMKYPTDIATFYLTFDTTKDYVFVENSYINGIAGTYENVLKKLESPRVEAELREKIKIWEDDDIFLGRDDDDMSI